MFWMRTRVPCVLMVLCSAMAGCGNGLDTVPVKGVLTLNGKPVPKIAVSFMPEGGKGQIAQGVTDAEGKFELQTREPGDGAMVGNYQVAFRFVPDEVPEMPGFPGSKPVISPLPPKYADSLSSGVTATVTTKAEDNVFNFDLK
ncbi:MAG: Ig-like domain-containing protein [Planctomycetales bacterium]|nr:Ig-like domain-containing protein [Planctomycetales bacterium]